MIPNCNQPKPKKHLKTQKLKIVKLKLEIVITKTVVVSPWSVINTSKIPLTRIAFTSQLGLNQEHGELIF